MELSEDILPQDPETENPVGDSSDVGDNGEGEGSKTDALTVKKWLSVKMPLLSEDSVIIILAESGIQSDSDFFSLSERERDLLLARGYFEMVMMCSSSSEIKDTDGNWSHSEGARKISEADRQLWKNMHRRLRKKWGEIPLFPPAVKIHPRGFKTWRRIP